MESKLNGGMLNTATNPSAVLDIFNPFRQNYGALEFGRFKPREETIRVQANEAWNFHYILE